MKVSIIIPVYNVSNYIERCIRSVMHQTYFDIECILIDDCTPDDSLLKCEKLINAYTGSTKFVILHHEQNRGLSAARNTGMTIATGEYIYFLDSDDWISFDCIEKMVNALNGDYSIEMVMGGIRRVGDEKQWNHFLKKGIYISNFIDYACSYKIYTMAWNKLIRLDFLRKNNLFFQEGLLHEDELWNIQMACFLSKIASLEDITYYYQIRFGSIQNTSSKEFHLLHTGEVKLSLIRFVFEKKMSGNETLYHFITNGLTSYMCHKSQLSKDFYYKFRDCPYWSIKEQKRFGEGRKMLLLALNRLLPGAIGLHYYQLLYKLLRINKDLN